ncbi:hypothetical protein KDK95_05955 [Actinospica sp. MGRD01-02]|uniref:Uncharacterized protein n=1 Tax=Actinospica acidithermotolerans TaxID=2828514 RepID=A0A941E445_9ACTN|nr:hypothetical protein [Actinospica acidithermotolerans]MBR7825845.1 hypothetical protein [Actinospica acidithermotolerans]
MATNQVLLHTESAAGTGNPSDTASYSARSSLAYLEAAGALTEHWRAHPREALAWPTIDTYRTSAELAVKDAIRLAARCMRSDGARGAEVDPGILEARMSAYTTLGSLTRHLNTLLRRVPHAAGESAQKANEMLERLLALDAAPNGLGVSRAVAEGRSLAHADLEEMGLRLTEAVMFLAHEVCGALTRYLALHGEA